ncbi:TrkA family potassium uptake protein [Paenibacillus psychroresistens]|uniref:TrkA family potassium uptake protein n=1 Tax=Paenibacillus psychroresistens TaxID=1778678 RepID=A0A6B8RVB4_9BACL|nr:TrkA family potassium uptake protein [Paenibacillus psychroresistens]QGQ99877.1 TrkA family potassium uptake protein [Paenibacillus psychroresistens]
MAKQFVVIGLGRFGGSVTRTLIELGHEVMAIDSNARRVQEFSSIVQHIYQADSTDEQVLKELGVRNCEHAIVAIGEDIQASILTSLILKDLGIKKVTAKAVNDYHSRVLEKIGVDHVVHPERDTGIRVAHQLNSNNLIDFTEITADFSLVEVSSFASMHGKTLKQLNIRARYGCTIVAIKKPDNKVIVSPNAEDKIHTGDILIIIGSNKQIHYFEGNYE